jgi:transposase
MTYYTGLDVSLRSVSICIIDDQGMVRHEAKVAAEVDQVTACLRAFSQDVTVVGFEAGTLTQYLTYGLQAAGFEVVCMEARQVAAALSAMRNKTTATMRVVSHRSSAPVGTAQCT